MTKKQFSALGKQLLPALGGYVADGALVFRAPVGHTLRGLCFERREVANSFYLWVFFQPLCIPTDHVMLSFGKRLGGGSHSWEASSADLIASLLGAVNKEAVPFLKGLDTPEDVAARIEKPNVPSDAFYKHEALGFMLARSGRVEEAIVSLDRTIKLLKDGRAGRFGTMVDAERVTYVPLGPQPEWEIRTRKRAALLKSRLTSDPASAARLLDSWEEESIRNLKLERFH